MFRILKDQQSKHSVLLFGFFDDQDIKIKVMYKIKNKIKCPSSANMSYILSAKSVTFVSFNVFHMV